MGEAKRRGDYQDRVSQAIERAQAKMNTKLEADIRLREHLQQLEARRAQMEQQMGPMDKLYVNQHQMLQQVAERLKRQEGVQVVAETDEAMVISIASPESLGTVIEGEVLGGHETVILDTPYPPLSTILEGGIPVDQMLVISSETGSAHFDDLAPIVATEAALPKNESQT